MREKSYLYSWGNAVASGDVFQAALEWALRLDSIRRCCGRRKDSVLCFERNCRIEMSWYFGCFKKACGYADVSKSNSALHVDQLQVWRDVENSNIFFVQSRARRSVEVCIEWMWTHCLGRNVALWLSSLRTEGFLILVPVWACFQWKALKPVKL